jgi:carboxyl-terminal processing protease
MDIQKIMRSQRIRLVFLSASVALCLFFVLERNFLPGISQRLTHKGFDLLANVTRLVKNDYIDERDPAQTMDGAYKGLIDSLDPVSSYLGPDATAKYLRRDSRWADIGVVLFKGSFGLFPQIAGIVEDSPAEKAGLKPGDTFSAMDGRGTLNWSSLEANLYLKDLEQKPVSLKVLRENQTLELQVERVVLFPEPFSFSSTDAFAVLSLHNLYAPCVSEVRKKILPLLKSRKKPLVLDLRNCYEGEIEEARDFLNIFIQSPRIGDFEKKGGIKDPVACPAEPDLAGLPAALWTNRGTMGASELVAAVLQETKKVKVIGSETLGLVSRQELFPLQDGSSVLVTSGIFTLASGKKLWEEGVVPDEKIGFEDQSPAAYLKRTAALFPNR